jgi:hypothetical protein
MVTTTRGKKLKHHEKISNLLYNFYDCIYRFNSNYKYVFNDLGSEKKLLGTTIFLVFDKTIQFGNFRMVISVEFVLLVFIHVYVHEFF